MLLFLYSIFGIEYRFREWLVTDVNFTSVIPDQCTDEDFFSWTPTGRRSQATVPLVCIKCFAFVPFHLHR